MSFANKTTIGITLLIALFVFLYLFTGVFGDTRINLTLRTNPDLNDGLLNHWTFDGKGNTDAFADRGSFGYDAYMDDIDNDSMATRTSPGVLGQAIYLDGDDTSGVEGDTTDNLSTFSYCLWFFVESFTNIDSDSFYGLISKGDEKIWRLDVAGGDAGRLDFDLATNDSYLTVDSSVYARENEWNHACLVVPSFNAGELPRVYLNNEEVSTLQNDGSGTADSDAAYTVKIGSYEFSEYSSNFFGNIDDVRIYSRELSGEDVQRIFDLGATTKVNKTITASDELKDGLVGHWSFDGSLDTLIQDLSGTGNDGYFSPSIATTSYPIIGTTGQGIEFVGSTENRYVDVGSDTSLDNLSQMSICAWVNYSEITVSDYIVSKEGSGFDGWAFYLNGSDEFGFYINHNGGGSYGGWETNSGTLIPNEWQHLCATYDRSDFANNDAILYINASTEDFFQQEINTPSGAAGNDGGNNAYIGRSDHTGNNHLSAEIDDLRIYNKILSTSTIERIYQLGATTKVNKTITTNPDLENGLVGHWTFDGEDIDLGSPAAEVIDRSTNGNNGDWQLHATTTRTGKIGQAISFDGTDDYIDVGDPGGGELDFGTGDFTLTAWINPDTLVGDWQGIVFKGSSGSVGYGMGLTGALDYVGCFIEATSGTNQIESTRLAVAGEWQFVACIFDRDNAIIQYINDELIFSEAYDAGNTNSVDSSTSLSLGAYGFTVWEYDGKIDDVRIYNRALSEAEILRLYQLGQ